MRQFFVLMGCILACNSSFLATAAEPAPAASSAAKSPKPKHRLVLCNDGGTLGAPDMEAPIGIEGLVRETIDPLRDTMIDTLYWQLGTDPYWGTASHRLSDQYSHNTKVAPRWGQHRDKFKTAGEWRIYENTRQIMEHGTDPPAVVIEAGHRAGLDVYLSLRVNDTHDSRLKLDDINMTPTKRAHPEWLLGLDGWGRTLPTISPCPKSARYRFAMAEEAIANYDLDGLNIDYCRHPNAISAGRSREKTPRLITEWMQKIRACWMPRASEVWTLAAPLGLRVPAGGVADMRPSRHRRRLVDQDRVGRRGHPRRCGRLELPPADRGVPRTWPSGTGCKILAQNLCAYKEDRGRSAGVLFGERNYYSTEQFRAVAARHWQAGANGIFIWNQHFLKFDRDDRFDRQSWKEIGDPQALARKDKHYLVGPKGARRRVADRTGQPGRCRQDQRRDRRRFAHGSPRRSAAGSHITRAN